MGNRCKSGAIPVAVSSFRNRESTRLRLLYPHATVDVFTDKLNGKACSIEQARRPASLHFYINELSGEKPG